MSILFLNILTLLAPTQSADNLFHSFTVLCENEMVIQIETFFLQINDDMIINITNNNNVIIIKTLQLFSN